MVVDSKSLQPERRSLFDKGYTVGMDYMADKGCTVGMDYMADKAGIGKDREPIRMCSHSMREFLSSTDKLYFYRFSLQRFDQVADNLKRFQGQTYSKYPCSNNQYIGIVIIEIPKGSTP